MEKVLILYEPRFASLTRPDCQRAQFAKNRGELLRELRFLPALRRAVKGLNRDTLYRLELWPKGATLHRDGAGKLKGVFYKDGKILKHARLKEVRPSLVNAVRTVGSQVLLIGVVIEIGDVKRAIRQVSIGLHNDRLAEIDAGKNQLTQALAMQESIKREHAILHAIQPLNAGVAKTIRSLKTQIADLPDLSSSFSDNWGRSKAARAQELIRVAEQSYHAALFGIQLLSESYALLGEPEAAAATVGNLLSLLANSGIEVAAQKARLVPYDGEVLPERQWELFLEARSKVEQRLRTCFRLGSKVLPAVTIELKPEELAGGIEDAEVQKVQETSQGW